MNPVNLSDNEISLRQFDMADYPQVSRLWQGAGLSPRPSDSAEEVKKKLRRDANLFLVACHADRIVGSVMGGWDGRRGWVYRMAVHPDYQRRCIGDALMCELEARLRAKGALAINIIYNTDNASAHNFYRSLGYKDRRDVSLMGKSLIAERKERPNEA